MPYIENSEKKETFRPHLNELTKNIESKGELNYCITRLLIGEKNKVGLKYDTLNDLVGCVVCALFEFWTRLGSPYENIKKINNGDVYNEN